MEILRYDRGTHQKERKYDMKHWNERGTGLLLCLCIAIPCWMLGRALPVIGGPVFAILAGMAIALLVRDKGRAQAGIAYTSKTILQYAVILLGFGLNLSEVAKVGVQSLPIILSTITTSLVVSFLLHRLLHIPSNISTLVGVGSSVCGGSAIAATAPVIGADDEEIAQSISVIFLFNVAAALLFPTLGGLLGLGNEGFGLFAGTAVNDTSSVTAAAAAWDGMHPGANTLDTATIVKLTRTLAIIPITLALALRRTARARRAGGAGEGSFSLRRVFPLLPPVLHAGFPDYYGGVPGRSGRSGFCSFKELSKFFIIMAMAAIGLNTDLIKLVRTGGRPILMGLCCWAAITAVSLGMQYALDLW